MGEPAHDGAAAASSSSSSSSSSFSGAEEHAFEDQFRGHGARAPPPPPTASVGQRTPRRLWAAARAGSPRLRQACNNAARDLVAWTRQGGAPRALLVVSVSLDDTGSGDDRPIDRSTRCILLRFVVRSDRVPVVRDS